MIWIYLSIECGWPASAVEMNLNNLMYFKIGPIDNFYDDPDPVKDPKPPDNKHNEETRMNHPLGAV